LKLQELISQTELDMTVPQVKAFLLGNLCAEKPMGADKLVNELLADTPEAKTVLESELKSLYSEIQKNFKSELSSIFPSNNNLNTFFETAKDQVDFFLTAMSLAGTNAENCDDEELAEFIDELEDCVSTMEDFLSEEDPDLDEGEDFKKYFLETWAEFVSSKK
jgi:uncharacterized protein YgfB (UPF0149 family)